MRRRLLSLLFHSPTPQCATYTTPLRSRMTFKLRCRLSTQEAKTDRNTDTGSGAHTSLLLVMGVVGAGVGWYLYTTQSVLPSSSATPSSSSTASPPAAATSQTKAKAKVKRFVLSGGPGSGKGTQSELVVKKYGHIHISSGDLLRAEVKKGTPDGKIANEYMSRGDLAPNEVVDHIVKSRLYQKDCQERGFLLDGYPRRPREAVFLSENKLDPEVFIILDVPDDVLLKRLTGRRFDPVTQTTYHLIFAPPPNDPEVLKRLEQRSDDSEESARKRLKAYHDSTVPTSVHYAERGLVVRVNGNQSPAATFSEVSRVLETFDPQHAKPAKPTRAQAYDGDRSQLSNVVRSLWWLAPVVAVFSRSNK